MEFSAKNLKVEFFLSGFFFLSYSMKELPGLISKLLLCFGFVGFCEFYLWFKRLKWRLLSTLQCNGKVPGKDLNSFLASQQP